MFEDDACLKKMLDDLAQVINNTVSESTDIRKALNTLRKKGYAVDVSLAACIGLYTPECPDCESENITPINFEFNKDDLAFLKSLKIKLNEK